MASGARCLLPRTLVLPYGLWMIQTTIRLPSWFRHFVKGHPQFLKKLESGTAFVERRTKTNSRNAGVAVRHVRFVNYGGKDNFRYADSAFSH